MKKEPNKKPAKGTSSFHLGENLKEALRVAAEQESRSMSNMLEQILKQYFESKSIRY